MKLALSVIDFTTPTATLVFDAICTTLNKFGALTRKDISIEEAVTEL